MPSLRALLKLSPKITHKIRFTRYISRKNGIFAFCFCRDVSLTDGFFHSTPITKRNVASTPNLSATNGVYLLDEPIDSFLHSSTQSMPRKSALLDKSSDDAMKKVPSSSGSAKGVHFCPVVSEVSWNETSSEEEEEKEGESSVSVGSEEEEEEEEVGEEGGEVREAPAPVRDHVTVLHCAEDQKAVMTGQEAVGAMEPAVADGTVGTVRPSRSAKFGSFLSRFASFRFSSRKDKKKPKGGSVHLARSDEPRKPDADGRAVDYIYIPLKGPLPSSPPVENVVTSKPPLPKAPPPQRASGARAGGKRDVRPAIDQAGGGSIAGTVTTSDRRTATVRNACSMEPMGLIETDLDTQVTVITAGAAAHVKTRSLMNLGPAPQPLQGIPIPQQQDQRPHKSMEFLLDKENLKSVQVSRQNRPETTTPALKVIPVVITGAPRRTCSPPATQSPMPMYGRTGVNTSCRPRLSLENLTDQSDLDRCTCGPKHWRIAEGKR